MSQGSTGSDLGLACPQIDGNRKMETVFGDICSILDDTVAKKDPLEGFCQKVPEADECRVYE